MASNGQRNGIDLEAVICVDVGHHWAQTFLGRASAGKLRGLPIRVVICNHCHSTRTDYLTWGGQVTSRVYEHDNAYIENARHLDDNMHERRIKFRAELVKQVRNMKIAALDAEVEEAMAHAG